MDCEQYKAAIIALFKSGNATDGQWDEMASCVLVASENENGVPEIDAVLLPDDDPSNDDEIGDFLCRNGG